MEIVIKRINEVAIGIPIFFGLLGFAWNGAWTIALLTTMLTGLLQVIAAILYFRENPGSLPIKIYLGGVVVFFNLWFAFQVDMDIILLIIPPVLCCYLCWIIYTDKTANHENE